MLMQKSKLTAGVYDWQYKDWNVELTDSTDSLFYLLRNFRQATGALDSHRKEMKEGDSVVWLVKEKCIT